MSLAKSLENKTKVTPKQFLAVTEAFFSDIELLGKEAGDVVFNPEAEEYLGKLLEIQEVVEEALDYVKGEIGEAGTKLGPNFKGFKGEYIDGIYRKYGAKYKYDKSERETARPYLKEVNYFKVDSSKVDMYLEEVGELPPAISEKDRKPQLTIKLKDERKMLHGDQKA